MMFIPRVGGDLTVALPGETMRAKVTRVLDRHTVFVEIGQPMTRGHNFRLGDLVACRRTPGMLGESWVAMENRAPPVPPKIPPPERKTDAKLVKPAAPKAKRSVAKVLGKLKAKRG